MTPTDDYRTRLLTRGERMWLEPPCAFCGEAVLPTHDHTQAPQFLSVPGMWAHAWCYRAQAALGRGTVALEAHQTVMEFGTEGEGEGEAGRCVGV